MYKMFVLRVCNEVMRCAGFRKPGVNTPAPCSREKRKRKQSQPGRASCQQPGAHSTRTCSAGTLRLGDMLGDDWKLPRSRAAAETALGPWACGSQSASSMGLHLSAEGTTACVSSSPSQRGHRFSCRPSSALSAVSPPSDRSLPSRPARSWSEHGASPPGAPARLPQPKP